jgi:glycosyltransferase involved in cell wall biosynthesis
VPSLVRNSDMSTTEIIVVDNGPNQDFSLEGVKVIRSEPYHIPKGYNAAVAEAKGDYIALFHDDCLMNDPLWIEKSKAALNQDVIAVGPDLRQKPSYAYLKETPLVMHKQKFLELGGYDESHYIGYQAALLCIAINKAGKQIQGIDIDCTHFAIPGKSIGMSTVLLLANSSEKQALRRSFASQSFGLQDMERILDDSRMMMRARYFIDYLVFIPSSIYVQRQYPNVPQAQLPSMDELVSDGVLHRMMPKTRAEMDKLIFIIGYHNELFDRMDNICDGKR